MWSICSSPITPVIEPWSICGEPLTVPCGKYGNICAEPLITPLGKKSITCCEEDTISFPPNKNESLDAELNTSVILLSIDSDVILSD